MSRVEPDSTKDSHQAFTGYAEPESVRLSVNLAPHVAKELRRQAALGDGTATLAVNNAILLAKIMLDARAEGKKILLLRYTRRGRRKYEEVIWQ